MPKKEVFLSTKIIEHILKNHNGKYSEYIREAVEDRYTKEKEEEKEKASQ